MADEIRFNDARARTYRKRTEVLAYRSDDAFRFTKSWGDQVVRPGSWVIVPLSDDGTPSQDIYGCDADVFAETYEPSGSLRPHRFRKKETVRAYKPGQPFAVKTVLADDHVEVESAASEGFEGWVVRAPGGETYPVDDETFTRTYVEARERATGYRVKTRDEHWAADGTAKRILALDGGGVRGTLTLGYLERIEELLRERHGGLTTFRLSHYFDLIAGTSTGAIIAACLAMGMTVDEVRTRYDNLAKDIFRGSPLRRGVFRAKFSARQLRGHLQDVFRKSTLGSSSLQTGLLVVAKRLDRGSVWPMSNNPRSPFFTAGPTDSYLANEDYPLRKVVRASTAAPSYFRPEYIEISADGENPRGEFVDGGVSPHNNPALLALQFVAMSGFRARWALDPDRLLITSVGTGAAQPGVSRTWIPGHHAVASLLSLREDCAELVETMLQWLSSSPTARVVDSAMGDLGPDLLAERPLFHYLRYNVELCPEGLAEDLGRTLTERQAKDLQKMDRPGNMPLLSEIGRRAASRQVATEHFPAAFDLG